MKLFYTLKKEFLLITRDIHAVAVLFVMPALFIIIMSLAMRDLFDLHQTTVRIDVLAVNRDAGRQSEAFLKAVEKVSAFTFHLLDKDTDAEKVIEQMHSRDARFALFLRENFSAHVEDAAGTGGQKPLELLVDPAVNVQTRMVLRGVLEGRLAKAKGDLFIDRMGAMLDAAGIDREKLKASEESQVEVRYTGRRGPSFRAPSAVQQSVPAWLVFSMFFIVIPLSNTFISERGQGTLVRLKSMNVSRLALITGKMVPYLLINAVQVLMMLAIGVHVVPFFGGTALTLGDSPGGLVLIAASVSFCAISLALLIASVAGTTEQATTMGGVLNIIFGALGGIMVPKFVMPGFMQELAILSPMSWGLEGFLDIFLRGGGAADILPESLSLLLLGAAMLILTLILLRRRREV